MIPFLKRGASYLALFSLLVLLFIYLRSSEVDAGGFKKLIEVNPEASVLLIYGDARSKTTSRYIEKMETFIAQHDLDLELVIKSSSRKQFKPGNETTRQLSDIMLEMEKNTYAFWGEGPEPILRGRTIQDPGTLKQQLLTHFGKVDLFHLEEHLRLDDNIQQLPFSATIKGTYENAGASVYVFYENICTSCSSGTDLYKLADLDQAYKKVHFRFVTITDYSDEMLQRFIEDHGVEIPILKADSALREYWQELKVADVHRHPLQGLILAIDSQGIIRFLNDNQDFQALMSWLNNQTEGVEI